jgi:hypothetical protein
LGFGHRDPFLVASGYLEVGVEFAAPPMAGLTEKAG